MKCGGVKNYRQNIDSMSILSGNKKNNQMRIKKFFKVCVPVALFAAILSGCTSNHLKDVDISNVKINPAHILRLDEDIFSIPPDSFSAVTEKMTNKYHSFYNSFIF